MNNPVKLATIQKIAKDKGLTFAFEENDGGYVMRDRITNEPLMLYAAITVANITNVNVWREECNKLKAQSFR